MNLQFNLVSILWTNYKRKLKAQQNKIKGVLTTKFIGFAVSLVRDTEIVNFHMSYMHLMSTSIPKGNMAVDMVIRSKGLRPYSSESWPSSGSTTILKIPTICRKNYITKSKILLKNKKTHFLIIFHTHTKYAKEGHHVLVK